MKVFKDEDRNRVYMCLLELRERKKEKECVFT